MSAKSSSFQEQYRNILALTWRMMDSDMNREETVREINRIPSHIDLADHFNTHHLRDFRKAFPLPDPSSVRT